MADDEKFPNFVSVSYFYYIRETPISSLPTELIACTTIDMHTLMAKLIYGPHLLINLISY